MPTTVEQALSEGSRMTAETLAGLRSLPILDVVSGCQEALTSTDDRAASIALHVLGRATEERPPNEQLNKASVITLVQFLGLKAKRHGTCDAAVESAANLVRAIAKNPTIAALLQDVDVLQALVVEFFPHIHAQSLLLNTRRHYMQIYKLLITSDEILRAAASVGGGRFLKYYISSGDGERDPALLLDVFTMHRIVATTFSDETLSFLAEDMFESMSAYFPVLFTPPPGCSVSREQLKVALSDAMSCAPFHELCIPFLCGKLSSPSSHSKLDSLELLNMLFGASSRYISDMLLPHVPDVLTALRSEALKLNSFHDRSPDAQKMLQLCLRTVTVVARSISHSATDRSILLSLLEPILGGALSTIETDTTSGRSYATLLHAVGRSNLDVGVAISSYLLPVIAQLANDSSSPGLAMVRQENCFSCLGGLLAALEELCSTSVGTAAVQELTNEQRFVRPQVLQSLYEQLTHATATLRSPFVLRVAGESVATWLAIAFVCGGVWRTSMKGHAPGWRLLLETAFEHDVDDDTSNALASALGNASRVDSQGFCGAIPTLLPTFVAHSRFLTVVEALSNASSRSEVTLSLISALLTVCTKEDFDISHMEQKLFALAATMVTKCNPADVQAQSNTWIDMALASSKAGVYAFEFATLLFSNISHSAQLTALGKVQGNDAAGGHVDPTNEESMIAPPSAHQRRMSLMIMCGASASAVAEVLPNSFGIALAKELCNELSLPATDGAAGLSDVVKLRCLAAIANKVTLDQATCEELIASIATCKNRLQVAAAIAQGLLSRGATVEGNIWLDVIRTAALQADDTQSRLKVASALRSILAPPTPLVSKLLWEQRFFHSAVQEFGTLPGEGGANMTESNLLMRLYALCAVTEHAKPTHIQVALPTLLEFVVRSMGSNATSEHWCCVAELLWTMLSSGSSSASSPSSTNYVHVIVGTLLQQDLLFAGLAAVLDNKCSGTMTSKRAALSLLKAVALDVERIKETMGDDDNEEEQQQGTASVQRHTVSSNPTNKGGAAIQSLSPEEALGAFRGRERAMLLMTQSALSHHKRLVRAAAADCRHVWSRVRR